MLVLSILKHSISKRGDEMPMKQSVKGFCSPPHQALWARHFVHHHPQKTGAGRTATGGAGSCWHSGKPECLQWYFTYSSTVTQPVGASAPIRNIARPQPRVPGVPLLAASSARDHDACIIGACTLQHAVVGVWLANRSLSLSAAAARNSVAQKGR